jgi:acetyl-CoA carboxylase biotin carboxyl carrier protein
MSSNNEFMPPDNDEIIEILNLVNESDFDELHLEMGGTKLVFSKRAIASSEQTLEPVLEGAPTQFEIKQPIPLEKLQDVGTETVTPTDIPPKKAEAKEAAMIDGEGLIPIKSPLLGIFYRSPKPGAPPFVEVGSPVTEDDTVCLVEVMKLFNTVKAGHKGRIVKICAENNEMVEYNQTLFLIEPEKSTEESPAP